MSGSPSSSPPRGQPPIAFATAQHPGLARSPSITGSVSGSASPSTRYGSFPPGGSSGVVSGPELEERLRGAVRRAEDGRDKGKARAKPSARASTDHFKRSWGPSSARILMHKSSGLGRQPSIAGDDVFDSDADLDDDDEETLGRREESSGLLGVRARRSSSRMSTSSGRERRAKSGGIVEGLDADKQPGVLKMEAMGRTWGRQGLVTIYAG